MRTVARILLGAIALLIIGSLLPGCSTMKRTKSTVETSEKSDSTAASISKTTITETIDTNITLPGGQATIGTPMSELMKGDSIVAEQNGTEVILVYNTKTRTVHATGKTQPRKVPVKATKTTEAKEATSVQVNKEAEHAEKKSDVKPSAATTISKTSGLIWSVTALLALLLLILWRLKR